MNLYNPKIVGLCTELRKINKNLPAAVYVPFFSSKINKPLIKIISIIY